MSKDPNPPLTAKQRGILKAMTENGGRYHATTGGVNCSVLIGMSKLGWVDHIPNRETGTAHVYEITAAGRSALVEENREPDAVDEHHHPVEARRLLEKIERVSAMLRHGYAVLPGTNEANVGQYLEGRGWVSRETAGGLASYTITEKGRFELRMRHLADLGGGIKVNPPDTITIPRDPFDEIVDALKVGLSLAQKREDEALHLLAKMGLSLPVAEESLGMPVKKLTSAVAVAMAAMGEGSVSEK